MAIFFLFYVNNTIVMNINAIMNRLQTLSNKFFDLIPHSGTTSPIKTVESIKDKSALLGVSNTRGRLLDDVAVTYGKYSYLLPFDTCQPSSSVKIFIIVELTYLRVK
jgi:hypothetical protein